MPLTLLGIKARDHWKATRPQAYAQIESENRIESFFGDIETRAQATWDQIESELIQKGYTPAQAASMAEEIILREHILLPPA
jgi:hypothetical protein